MRKLILSILVTALFALLLPQASYAGDISEDLRSILSGKDSNESVKVWIKLYRTEDIREYNKELKALSKERKKRHEVGVKYFKCFICIRLTKFYLLESS